MLGACSNPCMVKRTLATSESVVCGDGNWDLSFSFWGPAVLKRNATCLYIYQTKSVCREMNFNYSVLFKEGIMDLLLMMSFITWWNVLLQ